VLGAVLTQEEAGKEFMVAYASRRLVDAETRYARVEKLCLSLYFACSKFRHYILSNHCTVACQYDVIRYMMQRPILSGRVGKGAYSLVEYDLSYETLKAMKGQVVADFIVDHSIDTDDTCMVMVCPWRLFFDSSMCSKGCGVGCFVTSPRGVSQELSICLDYDCTNNQVEYEALIVGLESLVSVGATHVEAFGDSQLVVQQVDGSSQCLDGTLNCYREGCIELIGKFEVFCIKHVPRDCNKEANQLAQRALGFRERQGHCTSKGQPMLYTVLATLVQENKERGSDPGDWRQPLKECIKEPGSVRDRKLWRQALKYALIGNELYRRTVDRILLKCLDDDQPRVAMGDVHEGLYGTHQSTQKMKWMLRRAGFYWPKMVSDCHRYFRDCEACQRFGEVQSAPANMLHPIIRPWPFR
jgi:ribonuclease HI